MNTLPPHHMRLEFKLMSYAAYKILTKEHLFKFVLFNVIEKGVLPQKGICLVIYNITSYRGCQGEYSFLHFCTT